MTLREELIQYCYDVIAGNIIACVKNKWACMRFLRDIDKENTDEFPYVFDEAAAERFFDWMRLFKHTKGPLEGTYKEPVLIEKFIFGNIYGWIHRDTERRRFRFAYWQVGRKNAKSQDMAIMGLYEMSAFGEPCAEIYVAATKKAQTRYVWNEANLIYKRSLLANKFETSYGEIRHIKSESIFCRMSADDKINGDGSNPQCGILDEYHAHPTDEYYNILTSGMKSRRQPLLFIITTAGFDLNNPCYKDEYQYVSKILNPSIDIFNDRYFVMINELDKDEEGNLIDDIRDEHCWPKANPIISTSEEGMESIRAELVVALDKPEKMRDFLTKTCNVWVNQRPNGYMNMDKWAACKGEIPDLAGMSCIVGVDLSTKIDLTSIGFEFTLSDGRYIVLSHSFMPEDTVFAKRKTDKVPYDLWIKQGYLTATPGSVIDYRFVGEYMINLANENGWIIKEICFDPHNCSQFAQELQSEGYECIEVRQGIPTLGEPTKSFRDLAYAQRIIHDGNPVLGWAVSNAVTRQDHNANIMLDKAKSSERIDPIASLMNAHTRAIVMAEDTGSAYDNYDVREI